MGAKVTFNATTKEIVVTATPDGNGKITLDAQVDLYSDAKEDWLSDSALNKHRFPFRDTFGGQDLGGGLQAGAYYFLDNTSGWRIAPHEGDHELIINGNLYGVDPDTPVVNPTTGGHTVLLRLNTSQLTQLVTVETATGESAVWPHIVL